MTVESEYGEHPWRDEELLRELYHGREMTQEEVAEELECTKSCVCRWMQRHDIESDQKLVTELHDRDWLYEQYVEKQKSSGDIADELGCSGTVVLRWLDKHNIEKRKSCQDWLLKPHTSPRGHERLHTGGYEGNSKVKFHRLVAVAKFGIDPVKENEVHHKNGIKWDNRPSNLELLSTEEHARLHSEGRERDQSGRFA